MAGIASWEELRGFALPLGLTEVEDAASWGNPNLKAHGRMWCWSSPHVDAAAPKRWLAAWRAGKA